MNVHVRSAILVALLALAPAATLAQVAAAAPAQREEPPSWTIGAGISDARSVMLLGPEGTLTLGGMTGFVGGARFVPLATLFLERRIGDRTWLVFGATGSVTRDHVDAPAATALFPELTKNEAESVTVSAGLRRVVTRRGAPVDVSLQAVLEGGYVHAVTEYTAPDSTKADLKDWGHFIGVTGGIAVERELTGGLAVRLSTPLVGASYSKLERKDSTATRDGTSTSVFVTVAPRLELRLAF